MWFCTTLPKKLPGEDIVLILDGEPFHILQNSKSAQHVWRANANNYHKYLATYEAFFGKSRQTTDGALWRSLKNYSQPFITNTKPDVIVDTTVRYFEVAIEELLKASDLQEHIKIDDAFDFAAASTVCETTLGFPLDLWGRAAIEDLRIILRYASAVNWRKLVKNNPRDVALVDNALTAKERLAERLEILSGQYATQELKNDLLSVLLEASKRDVDLMGEVCTLLFASFETTSSGLGWASYMLASMPELQEKLSAQVRALPNTRAPTFAELEKLPDLQSFVSETLRMFPPVPMIGRRCVEADVINETEVLPNGRVIISIVGLHLDKKIYQKPSNFNLARFPNGKPRKHAVGNFLPFADGRRVCVGAKFANTEMLAALVVILRNLRLTLPNKNPLEFNCGASLRHKEGHVLKITRRS